MDKEDNSKNNRIYKLVKENKNEINFFQKKIRVTQIWINPNRKYTFTKLRETR